MDFVQKTNIIICIAVPEIYLGIKKIKKTGLTKIKIHTIMNLNFLPIIFTGYQKCSDREEYMACQSPERRWMVEIFVRGSWK